MKKRNRRMQWVTRICTGMLAAWIAVAGCTPVFLHAADLHLFDVVFFVVVGPDCPAGCIINCTWCKGIKEEAGTITIILIILLYCICKTTGTAYNRQSSIKH